MGKLTRGADLLDWTFSEAPEADEPLGVAWPPLPVLTAAPPPLASHWHLPRAWYWPGALALLALSLAAAFPSFQAWQVRRAVENLVSHQEQARLAGDWAGLRATFQDPAGDWAAAQAEHLQRGWQAAAFGLPAARLAGLAGQVIDYQALTPRLARVDVARAFVQADGTRAQFALSQFYQFSGGTWHQAPPPRAAAADLVGLHGARADVHYHPDDAALAAIVASDLDGLVASACADWDCPADLRVAVVFGSPDPAPATASAPVALLPGSLAVQMLAAGQPRLPSLVVNLPTRAWGGYPADGLALAAVRRAVALQVLANIGERLSGGTPAAPEPIQPLRYALIVREAARLGVEPATLLTLETAPLPAPLSQLWSAPATDAAARQALPAALSLLDGLLADQPRSAEQRLLHRLARAPDVIVWVADGLELTPEQARVRLASLWQD